MPTAADAPNIETDADGSTDTANIETGLDSWRNSPFRDVCSYRTAKEIYDFFENPKTETETVPHFRPRAWSPAA